ncbi:MAG: phospho-N-acetylmuramoyl-pentapeptide-transferase [Candidatus Riflebacteria bacterium]|nr:phospho-N-acetylmuramoyl-pentapeptide-transferase [Candidatus Riflebacteria bacterium]
MPGGITVRMLYALVTSFVICLLLSPTLIRKLKEKQIGQAIREEGVAEHKKKAGVPTMGGLLIVISMVISVLFWTRPSRYVAIAIAGLLWLGTIGFVDDYLKVIRKHSGGLSARLKLVFQILFGLGLGLYLFSEPTVQKTIWIPLVREQVNLGMLYVAFVLVVVVASSNAVNLTDGLDGLAAGVILVVAVAYASIAYVTGHKVFAEYLRIPYVAGVGELAVFCMAMAGACIGFLWYNTFPASVFMGDTGSLALGGAIGIVAILVKHELLLVLIGGIFVIETLSVIIQVVSFKTRGKRIFKMSPIHHHFELSGWAEPQVVIRFWIITLMLALGGLSVLGLNRLLTD